MSVLRLLLEVIGGEGVRIYGGDTAKTGHLPFKKIPEPGERLEAHAQAHAQADAQADASEA